MDVGVIGGGAAGFFSAISVKEHFPSASITILEKSQKVLAKVKVSGGGRCNITNGCDSISELVRAYPRGGRSLRKLFYVFSNKDTIKWFESRGVRLVTQDDNCVFPYSQNSQTIIDCLTYEAKKLGIVVKKNHSVSNITPKGESLEVEIANSHTPLIFDKVIVTTGGSPKRVGLHWLEKLGHKISDPVPSLFTFNIHNQQVTKLMGIVVENVLVNVQGTKFKSEGTLLITHWGMSGPAILKLSSYAARELSEMGYNFKIQINWANQQNNEIITADLVNHSTRHSKKLLVNARPYNLPERLWGFLLSRAELPHNKKWEELGKKGPSIN
jgi:predicted Rossmann fold flavoprotein